MPHHRLTHLLNAPGHAVSATATMSSGFMVCPTVLQANAGPASYWQQRLYAAALAEARAVIRPSILERFAACLDN